jgi:hypothetical protein
MSFTYGSLKTAIQDYTENDETTFVTNLPKFIEAAEDRIFTLVDLEVFRKNASGSLTANSAYVTVPTDYLASFSLQITESGSEDFLGMKDVNFVQSYGRQYGSNAVPKYYAAFDDENFVVAPTPDQNYAIELYYYYRPDSLTAGADSGTTWLSDNAPNTLLYGTLVEAYTFMKGEQDVMALYEKRFMQEIERLKDLGEARENSDATRRGLPERPRT